MAADFGEALKWYRLAANQGVPQAQLVLGAAYAVGRGLPTDFIQAHLWLSLAIPNCSGEDKKKGIAALKIVSSHLTDRQLAEAQRLASEWKSKH